MALRTGFGEAVASLGPVLMEGAVVERLRRGGVALHPEALHAGLVLHEGGRRALEPVYRGYLDAAREASLPVVLLTPTWRAASDRLAAAGLPFRRVQEEAVSFLRSLLSPGDRAFVLGLMGSRGDAYRPEEALETDDAERFHAPQAEALAAAGVEGFQAATQCAYSEALGLARAMGRTGLPYLVSWIVRPSGHLLDGTPLEVAVARLDREADPPPLLHMLNCVHWSNALSAVDRAVQGLPSLPSRLSGIQANTSPLPPEALDGRETLEGESPDAFAAGLLLLRSRFGFRLLGGCCGSDDRHIRALARALSGRA